MGVQIGVRRGARIGITNELPNRRQSLRGRSLGAAASDPWSKMHMSQGQNSLEGDSIGLYRVLIKGLLLGGIRSFDQGSYACKRVSSALLHRIARS